MKELYHHCTNYGYQEDCGLHRVIGVFVGYMKRLCEHHYKLHSTSMVCADADYSSEALSIKWIRFKITNPRLPQQKPMYYYKTTKHFNDTIMWTEPTESYRDANSEEYPWVDPTPPGNQFTHPVQNCVWVRHKHVMENESDVFLLLQIRLG